MSDHLMVDFRKWAKQSPEHMFSAWRQRLQKKTPEVPVKKPKSKVIFSIIILNLISEIKC